METKVEGEEGEEEAKETVEEGMSFARVGRSG